MPRHVTAGSLIHNVADDTQIVQTSITIGSGTNSTTEAKTADLTLLKTHLAPDQRILVIADRPDDATAKDITLRTYMQVKIDGTTATDVLMDTQVMPNVASARGHIWFILDIGAGSGDGTISFGIFSAVDGGAITVNIVVYAL